MRREESCVASATVRADGSQHATIIHFPHCDRTCSVCDGLVPEQRCACERFSHQIAMAFGSVDAGVAFGLEAFTFAGHKNFGTGRASADAVHGASSAMFAPHSRHGASSSGVARGREEKSSENP